MKSLRMLLLGVLLSVSLTGCNVISGELGDTISDITNTEGLALSYEGVEIDVGTTTVKELLDAGLVIADVPESLGSRLYYDTELLSGESILAYIEVANMSTGSIAGTDALIVGFTALDNIPETLMLEGMLLSSTDKDSFISGLSSSIEESEGEEGISLSCVAGSKRLMAKYDVSGKTLTYLDIEVDH